MRSAGLSFWKLIFLALAVTLSGAIAWNERAQGDDKTKTSLFSEVTARTGIKYKHHLTDFDGKLGSLVRWLAAFGGAGAAVGDFNNDGYDDLYVTNSRQGYPNQLYKNNGNGTFTEIGARAGVADLNGDDGASSDALWFDYNNDGKLDLLVLRFGYNVLFRNNGDETFTDVTAEAKLNRKWMNPLAAIAFDYDRDGHLDLLIGGYFPDVNLFKLETTRILHESFEEARNGGSKVLYRNNRDGSFSDVTEKAGIKDTGWTLDIGHGDYNNDGWPDVYIANDYGADKLFRNNGDGTFTDVSEEAIGVDTKKGMNADFADYDNDGFLDVYVTNITEHFLRECNMLWRNNGNGTFTDVSEETGACDAGWAWGAKFFDFDNDGLLDIYVVNGFISAGKEDYWLDLALMATTPDLDIADAKNWPPIGDKTYCGYERNKLFHNQGDHSFKEVDVEAGLDDVRDGRGVALIDFDNDGAMDVFLTNCNREAALYRNEAGGRSGNNFLELKLVGTKSNRDAIGARVKVVAGSVEQVREVNCGNGYAAQSTFRLHFGLGKAEKVERVEIKWPSGASQVLEGLKANRILVITEGAEEVTEITGRGLTAAGER